MIALAASLILLVSNLDDIPDCPELLSYGPQKAARSTTHHDAVSVPIVLGRMVWQQSLEGSNRGLYIADPMRVAPPCFVRIAQHAADPSPPTAPV